MSAPIITAPIITSALIPNIQFLQENTYSWVPNKRGVKINGGGGGGGGVRGFC